LPESAIGYFLPYQSITEVTEPEARINIESDLACEVPGS
jgi:hypothetical protein